MSTLQGGRAETGAISRRRWTPAAALFAGLVALAALAPGWAMAHPPTCPETWNPAEQPDKFTGVPGGWSTAPGTTNRSTPINPDGFFILRSDAGPLTLVDGCGCTEAGFGGTEDAAGGTCTVYGELLGIDGFTAPLTIKYTEANGKDADIEPMAGSKQPGSPAGDSSDYIQYHLWGQGDLEVCNSRGCTCCRVPPPPFSDEPAP
jgi:hypothetical protein